MIVYVSTFEEAFGITKEFRFLTEEEIPTVSAVTPVWTGAYWQLEIPGVDITDTETSKVQVKVGGRYQTVLSVGPTLLVVKIDDLERGLIDQTVDVYFSVGIPNGVDDDTAVVFTPKLVQLSTNVGSQAGSKIYA